MVTAEHDPLRDEGEQLARRLAEAGVAVIATRYLGQIHGFWRHPAVFPAAEACWGRPPRSCAEQPDRMPHARAPRLRPRRPRPQGAPDRWLAEHGYEAVDHGPFVYDALDDYPVFCLRAAEAVAQEREPGQDSLGVVIGGSGNGEQIAANKVAGDPLRAGLVRGDRALGRQHNDANVVSVGGRMHTLEDMTRFVEVFLTTPFTGDERHARRIGQLAAYEQTRELPPLPDSAPGRPPMPEGHTLHRLAAALDDAFAGQPSGSSSPQGRFAESAALLDGRVLGAPRPTASTSSSTSRDDRPGARPPRAVRQVRRHAASRTVRPEPVGPGAAAGWPRRRRRVRRPARRHRLRAVHPRPSATRWSRGSAPTRCAPTPTRTWPGTGSAAAGRRSAGCSWTSRCRRGRQRLPRRGALPAPRRPAPAGRRCGRQWRAMWDDLVVLMARRRRTGRIDTVRPEHLTDGGAADGGRPRRGQSYVYRRAGEPCRVCGTPGPDPVLQGRNLFWCRTCQRRFRSRALQWCPAHRDDRRT